MSSILFLSLVGPPDGVSTARLVGALAGGLRQRGHAVTILTTSPHYNRDAVAEERQPIAWSYWGLVGRSRFEDVEVVHVAMPTKGRLVAFRLMAWLWFHLVSTVVALLMLPRHDVIIAPSPPLTIGVSAWLLARLRRSSFVYNVQEIYPDIAVQLGALRSTFLIRLLSWLERFVYARADAITVISPRMKGNLCSKGVPAAKILEIPNFVEPLDMDSIRGSNNPFVVEHALRGKFVVIYAGNIGKPQGAEVLVLAAEALHSEEEYEFLIVGDGAAKADIESLVKERGLTNIRILPYQPFEAMPNIYAASSVSVVLQSAGTGVTATPSKAIQILGAGRPILAVTDDTSDLAELVREAGSGLVVSASQPERIVPALQEMKARYTAWEEKAAAACAPILERFSKSRVTTQYCELIDRLRERRRASERR